METINSSISATRYFDKSQSLKLSVRTAYLNICRQMVKSLNDDLRGHHNLLTNELLKSRNPETSKKSQNAFYNLQNKSSEKYLRGILIVISHIEEKTGETPALNTYLNELNTLRYTAASRSCPIQTQFLAENAYYYPKK